MDSAYRCPYDGLRMSQMETESYDSLLFASYQCAGCGHEGVESSDPSGVLGHHSKLMCKCCGCKRERARTGNVILEE